MIKILELQFYDGSREKYYGIYYVQNDAVGISFTDEDEIQYFYPAGSFKRVRIWNEGRPNEV